MFVCRFSFFTLQNEKQANSDCILLLGPSNQKRHTKFFKDLSAVRNHMKKHADLIRPKFEIAYKALEKLDKNVGEYSQPTGGYFITFKSQKPIASNIVELCATSSTRYKFLIWWFK